MNTRPSAQEWQLPRRRLSVGILLTADFTLSAFSLFVDTLRLADDSAQPSRCCWTIMAETRAPIRSSSGVKVLPDSGFIEPSGFDYVVVVGGILHGRREASSAFYAYLRRAAAAGVKLIGICTGSFILCRAGVMKGRRVCVSWLHYQDFRADFPDHEIVGDRLFEIDGDRITCAGGAGAADLATVLIESHLGSRLARKTHQVLQFAQSRGRDAVQPHPQMSRAVEDERVCRALLMMEQNLSDPVPISAIARRLDLSPRQLERRFEASLGQRPSALYRALRFRYAYWLLETTDRSVTDIALDSGFSDCAHFSRQFKVLYGISPSRMRVRPAPPQGAALARAGSWAGPRAF